VIDKKARTGEKYLTIQLIAEIFPLSNPQRRHPKISSNKNMEISKAGAQRFEAGCSAKKNGVCCVAGASVCQLAVKVSVC
jgi:hypothetical protein